MDISGLYWRRHPLSAARCPPGLLALTAGRLSFTTTDARVFDVPAATVSAALTGWGSLVVTANDQRYTFVTTVGQLSIPHSKMQKQAIAAAARSNTLRTIRQWPELLTAAGATVKASRLAYRPWLLGGLLVLIAIALVVLITVNGGL
ncbi:hypothetical protein BH11ACT2_BH11ACT2_12630 [soil metagenome]